MTRPTVTRLVTIGLVLLSLLAVILAGKPSLKKQNKPDRKEEYDRFTAPTTHYDLPVSTPPSEMTLETVQLYSRHGNRAADPIVEALCPKRKALTDLYHEQQASYGALTYNGIRSLWDLGRFTHQQYVKTGFVDGTYTRLTSQIRAAASDRTLISASSFGQTAYPDTYAGSSLPIPVAVLTSAPEEDNLLEVRKARCLERLETDLHYFDQKLATEFIQSHQDLISTISDACGFDIMHGPELTNGEFSVMQLVKDLSDALTGDLLEDFPLMDGVTVEFRQKFLQFAESIFKHRHYRTIEMDAYLAGNAPNRIMKLFDRRVSFNTNTTALDDLSSTKHTNSASFIPTYPDIITQDAKRLPLIRPRPPRRLFAYHAHREVLYGLKNFLKLDLGVERAGLPTGLIHPGSGIFFELWQNTTQTNQLIQRAAKENILPALNPDRKNSQRYLTNVVDDGYYLRILLWVPCFEGMTAVSALDNKSSIELFRTDKETGQKICLSRVRTLPDCDNLEFCPLSKVKEILATNYNKAKGDFRQHCPVHNTLDEDFVQRRFRPFQHNLAHEALEDYFVGGEGDSDEEQGGSGVLATKPASLAPNTTTTQTTATTTTITQRTTQQKDLIGELEDEMDYAMEHDSDSFEDAAGEKKPVNKAKKALTQKAGIWSLGKSKEDQYNNQYKSAWANNLATIGLRDSKKTPKKHEKEAVEDDEAQQ